MRTNIEINEALLDKATKLSAFKTKKAVVEEALMAIVSERSRRKALDDMWGMGWEGDLEAMRTDLAANDP